MSANGDEPYKSKSLCSLMDLLHTYEEEPPDALTTLSENVENRRIENKRYIWDSEEFMNVGTLVPSATINEPEVKATKTTSHGVQKIRSKIKSMQQELKEKTLCVNELKTTLARKRLSSERNASKLTVEWAEKMKVLKSEFDSKKQSINQIYQKNKATVEELKRKKNKLHSKIQDIIKETPSLCRNMESKQFDIIQKEQDRWKSEEKSHLMAIAKQKSAEMKSQASQALEPELRKLIEKHAKERETFREEMDLSIESTQEILRRDYDNKLQREMQNIDRKEEASLLEIDELYKGKVSELTSQLHNEKLAMVEKAKKDKDGLMLSLQVKLDDVKRNYRKALSRWEKECAVEIEACKQAMGTTILNAEKENSKKAQNIQQQLASGIEEWKSKKESEMKRHFQLLLTREEENITNKCEAEVMMIKKRLEESLNAKKRNSAKELELEIKSMRDSHDRKIQDQLHKAKSMQSEFDEFKAEENYIKEELKLTKTRLMTRLETLNGVESTDRKERILNEESERQMEIYQVSEKNQEEKLLKERKHLLQSVLMDLKDAESKEREKRDALQIEMQTLMEINGEEITKAKSRIDHVMERKNQHMKEKMETLSSLKKNIEEMEKKLVNLRKMELLTN